MHGMQSADGERMCVGWYAQCIIVLKEREKEKERVRVLGSGSCFVCTYTSTYFDA